MAIYHRQKDTERALQAQADREMQLDESIIKARNAALEAEEVQLLAERVKYRQSLIETVNKKNRPILVTTHGLSETTLKYASQLLELHKTYGYDIYSIGERACLLLCHSLLLFSSPLKSYVKVTMMSILTSPSLYDHIPYTYTCLSTPLLLHSLIINVLWCGTLLCFVEQIIEDMDSLE